MRLVDLLKDKLMGIYIDILRNGKVLKTVYEGMRGRNFVIRTDEGLRVGESVVVKLSFSGWNFEFPCRVVECEGSTCILQPSDKVKIREKRREKRIPCIIGCEIGGYTGTLLDVSFHGMRILTLHEAVMESEVEVKVGKNILRGTVRWMKNEEVDLKSVGVLLDDPPEWWKSLVKKHMGKYVKALRRL